ncbi:MAG TPA: monofunctional biosynthetic peptidoglycan transglycosylase [Candidatus Eisenbacteria bacterium]|nr:monofunctional biosynthetic peptidoglycan transglycosylase [Candidatus Eisenbacteria bacterium]
MLAAAVAALGIGIVVAWVAVSGIAATLPDVSSLERRAPERTALMRQRAREAEKQGRRAGLDQRWVSYERISPLLRRAVLIAEDDAFFSHDGLDWHEIRASAKANWRARRVVRGGSTITQQLAKNLYLGDARTLTRKIKEVLLAGRIERALSKRRIFELYLNLIEWGDGVYGIEAAAQRHFGVSSSQLDARQSALLAAVIINPRRYDPVRPARRIEKRSRMILGRMWRRGFLTEADYRTAVGLPPLPAVDSTGIAVADSLGPPVGPMPAPAPAPDSLAPTPAPEPAPTDTIPG